MATLSDDEYTSDLWASLWVMLKPSESHQDRRHPYGKNRAASRAKWRFEDLKGRTWAPAPGRSTASPTPPGCCGIPDDARGRRGRGSGGTGPEVAPRGSGPPR